MGIVIIEENNQKEEEHGEENSFSEEGLEELINDLPSVVEEEEEGEDGSEDEGLEQEEEEVDVELEKTAAILQLIIVAYVVYRIKNIELAYEIADEVEQEEAFKRVAERLNKYFETLAVRSKLFRKLYSNSEHLIVAVDVLTLFVLIERKIKEKTTQPKKIEKKEIEKKEEVVEIERKYNIGVIS
ncbi:hypothetical protein [Methanocaldococcus sp.]